MQSTDVRDRKLDGTAHDVVPLRTKTVWENGTPEPANRMGGVKTNAPAAPAR
jgi:hypothetical protein